MAINFFEEGINAKLKQRRQIKQWVKEIAAEKGFRIHSLNYVFCSDDYLYDINRAYLKHDTYTDIITFDQSEQEGTLEGDVFISVDRVSDNANKQAEPYGTELLRVIVHGLLHLCGYKDKTAADKQRMRTEEDKALARYSNLTVPRGTPKNQNQT
ncbi:rRNA maturation RNase YbeY [Cyclobacterium xiamenense]|jgi:rRNA maturation RNase YbeY|uniref:Endoribonuclease YbeY n=1 Tax=Cyclobacterium xiamenense TaxID=1297121 RepID=A0A1H6VQG7_9BACT|nr:rRNA maturation RNase YbeY [Cyclobacterium xiamenense]SEJ06908.1 rRNA maturation RNase YbeY [Cyclobacterium xiamenense]